jgi:hypothetical protein
MVGTSFRRASKRERSFFDPCKKRLAGKKGRNGKSATDKFASFHGKVYICTGFVPKGGFEIRPNGFIQ